MNYKIIVDSCGEIPKLQKESQRFESVPLTLMIGDYQVIDDETY